jgi:BioD-like phosphotransacetylase family protein
MSAVFISSFRENSGKTSIIAGTGRTINKKFGYLKPIGDRLVYKKKQLWDHDAAIIVNIFGMQNTAEQTTIGFDQGKLRHMYNRDSVAEKLKEMVSEAGSDLVLIEGGKDLSFGSSVFLDPVSVAKATGSKLIVVIKGNEKTVVDDIVFLKKYTDLSGVNFAGIIINKITNMDDFNVVTLPEINALKIPVLGAIPHEPELRHLTVDFIAERLFAKVLSGESNLNVPVKNILVGAMSGDQVLKHELMRRENKLIITPGDRSDMLLAALAEKAVAVLVTCNVLPSPKTIAKFNEHNIPLLLTVKDTFSAAKEIGDMEPLLTTGGKAKLDLLKKLVSTYVKVDEILS